VKLGTKANVFAPFRPGLKLLSKAGSKGNLLGSIPKKLYELFCIILRIEFHNHVSDYYFGSFRVKHRSLLDKSIVDDENKVLNNLHQRNVEAEN